MVPDGPERPGAVYAAPQFGRVGRGPGHDRVLGRHPGGSRVHDVGHDAGDVVRATAVQGEVDELAGDCFRVLDAGQRLPQRLVADHAGKPVRAEQVTVPGVPVVDRQVRLGGRPAVQGPQQQRALRVGGDVVGADPALVDQRLHQRVIVRDLVELPVAQQVPAGVADVAHGRVPVGPEQRGQRGAHALDRGVGHDHLLQPGVRGGHRRRQLTQHVAARRLGIELGHGRDGHGAGHLARGVATHPVRHCEQAGARVRRVLVSFAEEADVRTYRVAEY